MVARIPNDRPVRFAVVGVGQISHLAFIPGLDRTEGAELSALVTSSAVKAEELGQEYGVAVHSYEEYPRCWSPATWTPSTWPPPCSGTASSRSPR